MEGEQRWETNNGNSLESWGLLHRLEHQVFTGDNSVWTFLGFYGRGNILN